MGVWIVVSEDRDALDGAQGPLRPEVDLIVQKPLRRHLKSVVSDKKDRSAAIGDEVGQMMKDGLEHGAKVERRDDGRDYGAQMLSQLALGALGLDGGCEA